MSGRMDKDSLKRMLSYRRERAVKRSPSIKQTHFIYEWFRFLESRIHTESLRNMAFLIYAECEYDDFPHPIHRVDLAFVGPRVVVEIDGHEFHKSIEQRTNDAQRDRALICKGWKPVRFTTWEVDNAIQVCVSQLYEIILKEIPQEP